MDDRVWLDLDSNRVYRTEDAPAEHALWCTACGEPIKSDGRSFMVGPDGDALHEGCEGERP